jgi:peptidoglycan/xylan/chitin deacetylase (PgdA/CDA1 family)
MSGPFIFYHKIDKLPSDARIRGGYTPAKRFAKQMAFLKKQGFVFYTASEMIEHLRQKGSYPSRGLAITFDDGWKDNYQNAFPILRELEIKATIFLISSCVGQVSMKAQSEGESGRPHLSLEEIQEMSRYGIEFGSHTVNHKLLHQVSPSEVNEEVVESKKAIEGFLNRPCKVFAYPGGHFNEEARAAVANAGYIAGFTTNYGDDERPDLFALNRTEILRRDRFIYQFARKVRPFLQAGGAQAARLQSVL